MVRVFANLRFSEFAADLMVEGSWKMCRHLLKLQPAVQT